MLTDLGLRRIMALILAGAAFLLSLLLSWLLQRPNTLLYIVDRPGERSLHAHPTPRTGGLAILLAVFIPGAIAAGLSGLVVTDPYLISGVALMVVVSLWDDFKGLPPLPRIAVHIIAALVLLPGGYGLQALRLPGGWILPMGHWGIPLTLLFVLWLSNLYNFMDGMDGFAGGMGFIGFSFLSLLAWKGGNEPLAFTALVIALANLGFLAFNFPPARIFMGDSGSIPMGFTMAGISLLGVHDSIFPLWVPVLIFSPFIVDATVTLSWRLLRREKVWQAHRSHYYQRVVLLGWGHRKTVIAEYMLMLAAGGSAFVLASLRNDRLVVAGIALWGVIYLSLALIIRRAERAKLSGVV